MPLVFRRLSVGRHKVRQSAFFSVQLRFSIRHIHGGLKYEALRDWKWI